MAARVFTAFCHGAFFGIGAVVAADLVPRNQRSSAIALMFTGLTLANVLGVPLGTALGQAAGWRSTFWVVSGIGLIAVAALAAWLPARIPMQAGNILRNSRCCVIRACCTAGRQRAGLRAVLRADLYRAAAARRDRRVRARRHRRAAAVRRGADRGQHAGPAGRPQLEFWLTRMFAGLVLVPGAVAGGARAGAMLALVFVWGALGFALVRCCRR